MGLHRVSRCWRDVHQTPNISSLSDDRLKSKEPALQLWQLQIIPGALGFCLVHDRRNNTRGLSVMAQSFVCTAGLISNRCLKARDDMWLWVARFTGSNYLDVDSPLVWICIVTRGALALTPDRLKVHGGVPSELWLFCDLMYQRTRWGRPRW